MNRLLIGLGLIVIGALVGTYAAEPARGQGWPTKPPTIWPPAPDHIVNLRGRKDSVNGGDFVTVFTVPSNMSLVLTDARFESFQSAVGSTWIDCNLGEDLGGTFTAKIGAEENGKSYRADYSFEPGLATTTPYSSPIGLVFRPGSSVKLHQNGTRTNYILGWHLTGYLVDV